MSISDRLSGSPGFCPRAFRSAGGAGGGGATAGATAAALLGPDDDDGEGRAVTAGAGGAVGGWVGNEVCSEEGSSAVCHTVALHCLQ
eukprot:CAMPEP_0183456378 /NCGR_PEP_ID=MMETSP0370-20130417/128858_1 /TAXON_ID=268820 /ORGANISM="Peridinium aciculiferum, Strain PAER-2" /LENGTH=86 /DNA_ID=CAMNT_0025648021 /DNA_START=417 /DNA_END=674 /DNA_ORIENTATION=-